MKIVAQARTLLGTRIEIKLPETHAFLFPSCFEELTRIERTYSRFIGTSELSELNRHLGDWQTIGPEMEHIISTAENVFQKTNGSFDITLKGTLDELGYDAEYSFKARKGKSKTTKRLDLDKETHRVRLYREIEFGGLGKGFALDRIAALLESHDVHHYYINAGGDIYAKRDPQGEPWIILLEHPDDPKRAIGTMEIDGFAIAASAPNRRKWGEFHHLLNPKTGLPADEVKAIFVVAKTGIEADAYATALFCAGFEQGIELSKNSPVETLVISAKNRMYQSPGFKATIFS